MRVGHQLQRVSRPRSMWVWMDGWVSGLVGVVKVRVRVRSLFARVLCVCKQPCTPLTRHHRVAVGMCLQYTPTQMHHPPTHTGSYRVLFLGGRDDLPEARQGRIPVVQQGLRPLRRCGLMMLLDQPLEEGLARR